MTGLAFGATWGTPTAQEFPMATLDRENTAESRTGDDARQATVTEDDTAKQSDEQASATEEGAAQAGAKHTHGAGAPAHRFAWRCRPPVPVGPLLPAPPAPPSFHWHYSEIKKFYLKYRKV